MSVCPGCCSIATLGSYQQRHAQRAIPAHCVHSRAYARHEADLLQHMRHSEASAVQSHCTQRLMHSKTYAL